MLSSLIVGYVPIDMPIRFAAEVELQYFLYILGRIDALTVTGTDRFLKIILKGFLYITKVFFDLAISPIITLSPLSPYY